MVDVLITERDLQITNQEYYLDNLPILDLQKCLVKLWKILGHLKGLMMIVESKRKEYKDGLFIMVK